MKVARALVPLLAVGLVLLDGASSRSVAGAHAVLLSSQPTDGATLERSPPAVTLTFTEEPNVELSTVQIVDHQGQIVLEFAPTTTAPGDPRTIRVPASPLPDGAYTIVWRVVSRIDGHATAGLVSFGIGVPPLDVLPPDAEVRSERIQVSPLEVVGRWSLLAGLLLILGGAVIGMAIPIPRPGVLPPALSVGLIIAFAGLVGVALGQREAARVDLGSFLATSAGRAVVWRASALAVAGIGLALVTRRARVGLVLAAAGASGAMFAGVATGHAAASATRPWAEVGAQFAHVAAAGVWIGGLASLLFVMRGAPDREKSVVVRRFARVAAVALLVLVATGILRAFGELGRLEALFNTSYGRALAGKVGGLALLVVLGAVNRYRNVPRVGEGLSALRRISAAELVVATGVLAATALMMSLPPPTTASPQPPGPERASGLEFRATDGAKTVSLHLDVSPGVVGNNRFEARIAERDTGRPIAADFVTLRFTWLDEPDIGASTLELTRQGPGRYAAIGPNLVFEGLWELVFTIHGSGDPLEVQVHLATPCAAVPIGGGVPQVYSVPLPDGGSVQGVMGSLGGGRHQVHFTFLNERDRELRLEELATLAAWRPGTEPRRLRVTRLGPGHFVGQARLGPGNWFLQAVVHAPDGTRFRGCFEEGLRTQRPSG